MTDLRKTIVPKSDQMNADDLRGITKTIKVTKVSLCSEADQPIAINYEGDNGKPYKPCKSMRRVLVNIWGSDGATYAGRSMTVYCDDKVMFGGKEVGGIRISHMSNIDKDITMALTATRANRKPFTVRPLSVPQSTVSQTASVENNKLQETARAKASQGYNIMKEYWAGLTAEEKTALEPIKEEIKTLAVEVQKKLDADAAKAATSMPTDEL